MTPTLAVPPPETAYRITFGRVVRSEWTKLRSLRSTWITLGVTALLTIGLAGAFGYGYGREIDNGYIEPTTDEAIEVVFGPIDLPTLIIGVLGVLLITGEYSSGSIRATLTAVPGRLQVLWAKALVFAAVMAAAMLVICLASFLIGQAFIGPKGNASLGDPGALRAMIGAAANPVAYGLIGLGIGTLLRSAAGAITSLVAATVVVPLLLPPALPASVEGAVTPYSPLAAGQAVYSVGEGGEPFEMLSPGPAAVVLLAWVVVAFAAGAAALRRRDA